MKKILYIAFLILLGNLGFSQIINENFDTGITGTWSIVDNGTSTDTWYGETSYNGSTLDGTPFAFVNSDAAGSVDMNEELITPSFDGTSYSSVILDFDHYFNQYGTEVGDVDVWNGSAWVNVYSVTADVGAWSAPDHQTIDISAYINAAMKVRFHYYNANYDWYWAVDNVVITGASSAPMTYTSSTTTQNNTSNVSLSSVNNEVIGVEIVTSGSTNPLDVTSFTFNTTGTTDPTNDIINATLWSTGTSSTFATTTQVGSVVANPNGTFTITGTVTLSPGTNYFWLTYDIPITATTNNFIDAECSSVTIDGSAYTPTTTAPAGNRKIIAPPTFDGTFETATTFSGNGMTKENDTQNYWIVGTATNNGGTNSAYVTNDGTSNTYDNGTTTYSHFYFDYLFPAGQTIITLTFDWKCEGEGSSSDYDNLKIFIEPTTETPAAGTANNATYQVGSSWYNLLSTGWNTETITLSSTYAGTIKRIVFQWKNDGSVGTDPPAAVDNIIIDTHVPTAPDCAINLSPADGATDVCNATVYLSWDPATTGDLAEGYYLYFGTDNPPTNIVNGSNIGNVTNYDSGTLTENTTYYWQIIPYNAGGSATGCSVYSFTTGDGQTNDLPCNAESITLGSTASGNNDCTSDDNEPGTPSCWTSGERNTVWYSFVAPPSGSVDIATGLGTLSSTQVAIYSGNCDNLTLVECNDDDPNCGSNYDNTNFTLTGLTSGEIYFVVVDGEDDELGTFNITISDNSIGLPVVFGQDCGIDNAIPVCNAQFTVGDPGFQAVGNYCDFDDSQNCTGGERGSVWYHIEIGSNGVLEFTLTPNDYDPAGTVGNETDYDFLLYRVASGSVDSSIVDCSCINDNTCGPIRCNYDYLGITGMYGTTNNNAPSPYNPDYNDAFEAELNVLAGDEFYLVIQNYSNSTSGFSLDLNTTPITIPGGVPTSLTWTGGANSTDWYEPLNWGDCAYYPNENIDANIIASSAYQPIIDGVDPNNGNNAKVKSLTINSGANLTINNSQTLEVYGDYDNTGLLNANLNSTVLFTGTATQTIDGSLQGNSAFGNIEVDKTSGNVKTLQTVEVKGHFSTVSNSSIFDLNNKDFYLGGDFLLNAPSTFINTNVSYFLFNGSSNQNYWPNGTLLLNDVEINNTTTVTLSDNLNINTTGQLTLTNGMFNTGGNKVIVQNTNSNAIDTGNTNSYINGTLRAYIANNSSLYHFPVGDADQYTLAELQNHSLSDVTYLDVKFYDTFTNTGSLDPTRAIDFGTSYSNISSGGMWEIIPNTQPSSGTYDIFLNFDDGLGYDGSGIAYGNAFPSIEDNKFAVLKRNHNSDLASDWYGEAVGTINANEGIGRMLNDGFASRYGINTFSDFAIGISETALAIELLNFKTECNRDNIIIKWYVASEINTNYYNIQKSTDGISYKTIKRIYSTTEQSYPKQYNYTDSNIVNNISTYYRLQEVDLDNKISIFYPVAINCDKNATYKISATKLNENKIKLFTSIPNGKYKLAIYNSLGQIILTKPIKITRQKQTLNIDNFAFSKGMFLIQISNNKNKFSTKLIIN